MSKLKASRLSIFLLLLFLVVTLVIIPKSAIAATETIDGIVWTYANNQDGTVSIGGGSYVSRAVPSATTGTITIPSKLGGKTVTAINEYAFSSCSGLTEIIIPNTVTSIGNYAFQACKNITNITTTNNISFIGRYAFQGCGKLTGFAVPNAITEIQDGLFISCSNLSSITVPEHVTSIGYSAFANCTNLKNIEILSTQPLTIGEMWIQNCANLTNIQISGSNPSFNSDNGILFTKDGKVIYAYPAGKTDVSYLIPEGVEIIRKRAFYNCSYIENVTIPEGVTVIDDYAFFGTSALSNLIFPSTITEVGHCALEANKWFNDIVAPYTIVGDGVLVKLNTSNTNEESITIPNTVKQLGGSFLGNCKGAVKRVVISNSVKVIGNGAFYNSPELIEVVIPNNVVRIGHSSFKDCPKLADITIPNSITSLESEVFANCASLSNLTTDNITSITPSTFTNTPGSKTLHTYENSPSSITMAKCFSNIAYTTTEISKSTSGIQDSNTIIITDLSNGATITGIIQPLQIKAVVPTVITFHVDPNEPANYTSVPGGALTAPSFSFQNACNAPLSFAVNEITAQAGNPAVVMDNTFSDAEWAALTKTQTLANIAFGFVADTPEQWAVQSGMDNWYELTKLTIGTLNGKTSADLHLKSKYGLAWGNTTEQTITYDVVYIVAVAE